MRHELKLNIIRKKNKKLKVSCIYHDDFDGLVR